MMKRHILFSGIAMMLAAASLTLSAYAQSSTAFTYQGFLRDNGQPANGVYDLRFALYDSPSGGNQIGSIVFVEDVTVADGLFTVEVDFGAAPFNTGARRWIEIGVRPGNSIGGHSLLTPRIELTPVPYALYAQNVTNNAVSANQLANDPDSLSKVSGGNLSITDGFLKKSKHVYFRANGLVVYGTFSYRGFTYDNLAPSFPGSGWYALRFRDSDITSTNVTVAHADAGLANQDNVGTRVTVPVSGYYFIQLDANVYHVLDSYWHNGVMGIQVKPFGSNNWSILEAGESTTGGAFNYTDIHISTIAYLPAGTTIRAVANGAPSVVLGRSSSRQPSLVIYLLSAADEPQ